MNKSWILNVIITLVIFLTAFVRFFPNHINLPSGCDEFGYLQLSEAISKGKTFNSHTKRDFMPDLLEYLKDEGYSYREYAWIIAPHAYHLDKNTEKIINQYPPGTSALLSFFPIQLRQILFPAVVIGILLFILGIVIDFLKVTSSQKELMFVLMALFCIFAMTSSPMLREFTNVNSVGPTLGFLLAGGLLLPTYPIHAMVLIAFTVNFRLANTVVLPVLMLYAWFVNEDLSKLFHIKFLKKGLKILGLTLLSGFLLYFIYAYLLLGNPFELTYSEIDSKGANLQMFKDNVAYYFSIDQKWTILNLFCLLLITILWRRKKLSLMLWTSLVATTAFTYLYFLLHAAKTPYYPYAPTIIMIGVIMYQLSFILKWKDNTIKYLKLGIIAIFVLIMIVNWSRFASNEKPRFVEQVATFQGCFNDYKIVWGELRTSTVEYSTGVAAMRYIWGGDKIRADIMHWLNDNNYQQAIYLEDIPVEREQVKEFLKNYKLNWTVLPDTDCGIIVKIPIASDLET